MAVLDHVLDARSQHRLETLGGCCLLFVILDDEVRLRLLPSTPPPLCKAPRDTCLAQ